MKNNKCSCCGCRQIHMQVVSEVNTKRLSCLGVLFFFVLGFFTFGIGWVLPIITRRKLRTKVYTKAVCQKCGKSWKVR